MASAPSPCPACRQPGRWGFDDDWCHEDSAAALTCPREGWYPGMPEAALFPRFPAGAVLVVDAHNGDEQWTGEEWNAYAARCEASRGCFIVRLVKILDPGDPA